MSLITFRDRNSKGDPVGPVWYLRFDALTIEEFSRDAEVTNYPIETGATLSDHYQPMPRRIAMSGVVSDTPSGPWTNLEGKQDAAPAPSMSKQPLSLRVRPDQVRRGPAGVLRPVSTTVLPSRRIVESNLERAGRFIPKFAQTLQTPGGATGLGTNRVGRITSFFNVLDGLMESRTPVDVVLYGRVEFQNMMITSNRAPRVSGRGGEVRFSLEMQQVETADPAEIKAGTPIREPEIQSKERTGRKSTKRVVVDVPPPPSLADIAARGVTIR